MEMFWKYTAVKVKYNDVNVLKATTLYTLK